MDFMGFHVVDIVIVSLILFLAIKGLVNGFSKELLNFLVIVGGITLASRFNTTVVELINAQNVLPTISQDYAKIIGFILIVLVIWLLLGVVSSIVNKLTSKTTGVISRLLGYILSAARYVVIFSLIIFGVNQSDFFKNEATKLTNDTKLFVPMTELGAGILNIDLNTTVTEENNSTITLVEANITSTVVEESNLSTNPTTLAEHNTSN